ncbi:uncharacterized protein [Cherax quadricarinatus]|uniref:uncharacterized protein isoform X2 n=1 Tax=Cherax quadricarinatus TaxID=27406 RepID=UPI0023794954|nr:uncharacterized protein LOC128703803 isoform X2 [Cherax quadricarinatus]
MMLHLLKQVQIIQKTGWLVSRNFGTSLMVKGSTDDNNNKKTWYYRMEDNSKKYWRLQSDCREGVPESEWQGMLHHLSPKHGISLSVVHALQKGIDLRPSAIAGWYGNIKRKISVMDQSFKAKRVAALGYDLAAAHFLVHREGKVRFKDAQEWTQQDENGEYELTGHYSPNVFVEAIDASGIDLLYEGLESMCYLNHLKWLSVASCPNIDDWCIDRICCQYSNTLEYLDISNCVKVTEYGIAALGRLRSCRAAVPPDAHCQTYDFISLTLK